MGRPNKIYLHEEDFARIYTQPSSTIDDDIEYIRKDALMEWAKECFRLQDSGSWYSKGAADAFSKLINILNEM